MIGVVFYLEDIDNRLNMEMIDQIAFNARMLGATHLFMIDKTRFKTGQYYQHSDANIEYHYYQDFNIFMSDFGMNTFIFLENDASFASLGLEYQNIDVFTHPSDCIYIFGPDSRVESILDYKRLQNEMYVNIHNVENMYAHAAIIITLYDRKIKE